MHRTSKYIKPYQHTSNQDRSKHNKKYLKNTSKHINAHQRTSKHFKNASKHTGVCRKVVQHLFGRARLAENLPKTCFRLFTTLHTHITSIPWYSTDRPLPEKRACSPVLSARLLKSEWWRSLSSCCPRWYNACKTNAHLDTPYTYPHAHQTSANKLLVHATPSPPPRPRAH